MTITDYPTDATGAIEIPATIDGKSVTSIGDYAFAYCSNLTSITIPNSVISIGSGAFEGCTGLTSVIIPDSVTSIGVYAFYNCTGLTSVTIPNSVTSIADGAFFNCTGLTSIIIPNSVTSIGIYAFYFCTGLTSINIPDSVTSIGSNAFYDCVNLVSILFQSMTAPTIGSGAFDGISNTAIIKYPYGATGYAASYDGVSTEQEPFLYAYVINSDNSVTITDYSTDVSGAFEIPATIDGRSVTSIGDYAFAYCSNLTSITIPNSVISIGSGAFEFCSSLTSIIIPDSVTSIGSGAFFYCTGLTSITIPNSVTSIGDNAFNECYGLTSIVVAVDNPNYSSTGPLLLNKNGTVLITGPGASGDFTIPNSVTSIGNYAFYNCSSLTSVTIPDSVTSIGDDAFSGCVNLVSIRFQSMTAPTIGFDAFDLTSSAAIIYYPYGATGYAATYDGVPTTDNGFTADDLNTAVASATTQGQQDVVADPASYGLYTSANAQAQLIDLRTGSTMLNISGSNAELQLQIQRSDDLSTWTSTADDIITVELPMQQGKGFYRFAMPQE